MRLRIHGWDLHSVRERALCVTWYDVPQPFLPRVVGTLGLRFRDRSSLQAY